jgi:hypothetical protein
MKLRIRGNSLRLRLSKSEVEKFSENGRVSDEICFGGDQSEKMIYSLEKGLNKKINAVFQNGKITIFVPENVATKWTAPDEVGFESDQNLDDQISLRILVEKDFVCLSPRESEDESDNYSHPNQEKKC